MSRLIVTDIRILPAPFPEQIYRFGTFQAAITIVCPGVSGETKTGY